MQVRNLDATQFARLTALLDAALARPPMERDAWLADLTLRDPEAGAQVRELLASLAAAQSEGFLDTRAFIGSRFAAAIRTDDALIGRLIGPYRVQSAVGQGGMGTVWLAERADGLFQRKVALKLVHPAFAGSAVAERFARERAILAGLDHPHIARLFDAGVTGDGQPYLALEYVEGVPLTVYCDERRLDIRARIALFQQVLGAVQYAHTNLVIHRDLKSSNILVSTEGQVRLLDFGIAKRITEGDTNETALTQLGGRAFTPAYASPEQITGLPVTTASDVYALGVVFYELLCGRSPYALERPSRGALEDAILNAEPANPSDMIASDASAIARSTTTKALRQMLAGDLDTIALKALRKRPRDRYGSAHAMMQDLERFRRGEPVLARPDSWAYRFAKFVARNKLAVGAATVTALSLAVGLAGALWQAGVARDQATVARNETIRATAVQDFLLDLFRANSVAQPDPVKARQTTARELLDLGATRVDENLKDAPEVRATVLDTLADMYQQLGMNAEAARQRRREIAALKQAHGPGDRRVADALIRYATDIADLPERRQVLSVLNEAKGILDAAHDDASETRGHLLMRLAQANRYTASDRMRAYADEAVMFFRARYPRSPNLSVALTFAASARMQQGDAPGAEALYRQALAEVASLDNEQSASSVFPLVGLAEAQDALGKVDDAEHSYRSALSAAQARFGEFHPETLLTEAKLGSYLRSTARREEGHRWMQTAVAGVGKATGGYTPGYVTAVLAGMRGRALLAEGRLEEAAPLVAAELTDARENFPGSIPLALALRNRIALDTARGHYNDAMTEMAEALEITQSVGGAFALRNRLLLDKGRLLLARGEAASAIEALDSITAPAYAATLPLRVYDVNAKTLLAQARLHQGRIEEAIASAQDALEQVVASPLRKYYPLLEADAALRLGQAQRAAGEPRSARANLEHALRLREANDDPKSPWLAEAQVIFADCLIDLGERKQAADLLAKAKAIHAAHDELGAHLAAPVSTLAER